LSRQSDHPMSKVVDNSVILFRNGLSCSEAIVQAFNSEFNLGLNEAGLRVATVFSGGFGGSKCSCGALTGALIVLGAVKGRVATDKPLSKISPLAKELHDRFKSGFGQPCCRVLTSGQEWGSPEHKAYCERFVRGSTEILLEILSRGEEKMKTRSEKERKCR